LEALQKEEEVEKEQARIRARERVLRDFEKSQTGFGASTTEQNDKSTKSAEGNPRGAKRKFGFDEEKVESAAREAEEAALEKIEKEQAEARKAKLPDFWLPSLTPDAKASVLDFKDVKLQTLCNAVAPPHAISLKTLIPVKFSLDNNADPQKATKICPSCKKELTTNSLTFLMKPCSHVLCKTCQETLVLPSKQCAVCDERLKDKDSIPLSREGTGFAGGGRAETSKVGIAFQG